MSTTSQQAWMLLSWRNSLEQDMSSHLPSMRTRCRVSALEQVVFKSAWTRVRLLIKWAWTSPKMVTVFQNSPRILARNPPWPVSLRKSIPTLETTNRPNKGSLPLPCQKPPEWPAPTKYATELSNVTESNRKKDSSQKKDLEERMKIEEDGVKMTDLVV